MEVELFTNTVSEEDTVEVDVENDNFGMEGERCGICMDIVIDRGVLDCCQHWFCFVCIDNWASITNLCPLCQNEFQLITCVPVYDTIGGSKTDEDSDSRDDDWRVEGNNNTLSFPSYYIDENAVTCLDGDGCKIRSGSVNYEENSTLYTSIACDSCDIWYHAFCVGFDPEGTDVDSWLCPRCVVNEAQQKSDLNGTYSTRNQLNSENADSHHLVDTFSGKVFVSVADAGETAVVVSRIGGECVEDQNVDVLPSENSTTRFEVEQSMLGPDSCSSESKSSLDKGIRACQLEPTVMPVQLQGFTVKSEPIENDSGINLDLGLSLGATPSGEDEKPKALLGGDECLLAASNKSISMDESLDDVKADLAPKIREKRKRTDYSFLTNDEDSRDDVRLKSRSTARKVKAPRGVQRTSLNDKAQNSPSNDSQKTNNQIERSTGEIGENMPVKDASPIDIMDIVRGTESKKSSRAMRLKEADKCAKVQKNAAKLRVKKIMRRPSDDKESADVVQKLRKEIREAVRNKPSEDVGKSVFDPNLLAAFRAAVSGSTSGPVVKQASVKTKKIILQKSKARENLTKKIYATSNGRRRRAWDRDCEVEFWKHRCISSGKLEKIGTLRSVLSLLRKGPETEKVEQNCEEDVKAPLLSRLYLADASLFPRKDDIKPLSVLKATACPDNLNVKTSDSNGVPSQSDISVANEKKNKGISSHIYNGVGSGKLQADKQPDQKKTAGKTDDIKVDKRKWALEVLARKAASNSTSATRQKQDSSVLKGNYPLLAELPTDMWPKLAPVHHNKIPASVRQAQLYRLAEHFLKMANLPSIRRSATTELAIADAINIEKQVADRSNSKVVYLNLCSQEIRRHVNSSDSCTPVESAPTPAPTPTPSDPPVVSNEGGQSSTMPLEAEAEAALRAAGLLSDSPPSSPPHNVEDLHSNENPTLEDKEEEGMEDVLEMDTHPDIDIYGDFEYDLDEEFISPSAIKPPESQTEEGGSKVKVVFSTLNSNKADNALEAKEQDLPKTGIAEDIVSETKPTDTSLDGEGEELSLAECEALYGPEKEPLVKKFPQLVLAENVVTQITNNLEVQNSGENVLIPESHGIDGGGKPPCSFHSEEKSSDPKIDKKSEHTESVLKKVEAYIKEHIRPLCKSGVITVEQYRWAVGKTVDKVMKYHSKAKNANFLIKEGEKVKKLAQQYVDAAKHKEK